MAVDLIVGGNPTTFAQVVENTPFEFSILIEANDVADGDAYSVSVSDNAGNAVAIAFDVSIQTVPVGSSGKGPCTLNFRTTAGFTTLGTHKVHVDKTVVATTAPPTREASLTVEVQPVAGSAPRTGPNADPAAQTLRDVSLPAPAGGAYPVVNFAPVIMPNFRNNSPDHLPGPTPQNQVAGTPLSGGYGMLIVSMLSAVLMACVILGLMHWLMSQTSDPRTAPSVLPPSGIAINVNGTPPSAASSTTPSSNAIAPSSNP